jgi:hypothetical protein
MEVSLFIKEHHMVDTPLSDKDRAIILTRLGVKKLKGLRQWRDRLNIQPPDKPRKPRTPPAYPRYGQQVQCVETGKVYPSYREVARVFGSSVHLLKEHMEGRKPTYCGHTFKYWE